MKLTEKTLYAQGDLNHSPIVKPHSGETHAAVIGTTLILAHTSKTDSHSSNSFKKPNNIEALPEIEIESNEVFKLIPQDQITHLQAKISTPHGQRNSNNEFHLQLERRNIWPTKNSQTM
ncbi:hypothetical protein D3C86_1599080 [compost metagenome]